MADTTHGAAAPIAGDSRISPARRRATTSTTERTRRHGSFLINGHIVSVASVPYRVAMTLPATDRRRGAVAILKPDQARALARALHAAANAAEAAGVCHE